MTTFKTKAVFIASLAATLLRGVEGTSPFIIADDRIRSLDHSPVLGRGYSIMTNTFQSTCLVVEQTTVPSFNYDYFFTDFTSSSDNETELGGKISASLSYMGVKGTLEAETSSTSKESTQTRTISATMQIERYYSSVREEVSPLANDAFTLLESEDYVGFFKACGPNYVRGLRRAQEVTAIFQFSSSSTATSTSFSSKLQVTTPYGASGEAEFAASSSYSSITSSLTITIVGYGMGLNQEGSETMVATSLDEYQGVMRYAFQSMTVNEDAHNIGMVYGMEVVPWVNNVAFQVAAKVAEQNIIIPLPRSLIPKAVADKCKDKLFQMDKYKYCCEPGTLYRDSDFKYPELEGETNGCGTDNVNCVCRPVQNLDKALVKDNMSNNGEFVARIDTAMRYKLAQLAQLEKCISAAKAIPIKYENRVLKPNDGVKYDKAIQVKYSLLELKAAIDPLQNFGMVHILAMEMDEWIQMFLSPCMGALYGMNAGTSPDTETSYFMAYPWYSYSECMLLSCITVGMRWDREKGGCVPGMLLGPGALAYKDTDPGSKKCALDGENYDVSITRKSCKYKTDVLENYRSGAADCWNATKLSSGTDYMINHFCNPQLTSEEKENFQTEIKDKYVLKCKKQAEPTP